MNPIQLLLEHGGVGTYLISLCAMVFVVIALERLITLYFKLSFNTRDALETVRGFILSKRYTEALQVCNSKEGAPDLQVVKSALLAVENGREAMRSALGGALLDISHRCEARLQYLALIANVATLLGLFGTIMGLIKTFAAMSSADATQKAKLLGLGISEAMYSTAAGLVVGIAAMIVHTICSSKSESIVGHAQDMGYKVITWVEQSERARVHG